jgi:molybdopterin/thiamine biosynthesis adenylyltransferase
MSDKYITPRLKQFVEFYSNENKIYLFKRPGVAITLDDVSGFIFSTCKLMDGIKSFHQIQQILFATYPNESSYLEDLLTVLDHEFLLEDVSLNFPNNLSEYETLRWSRNIEFFGAYSYAKSNKYEQQEKLKSTKVTLLGLGGVGSHILYSLAALGIQNFRIVDFDKVELSNLNRQILYDEADIGQFKSIAAKNKILKFAPNANIEVFNKKISGINEIEEIIKDQDIVINAADQPRAKIIDWVNAACVKENVPFLCGALDSKWAICYTIIPGKTGCIECWKSGAKSTGLVFQDLIDKPGFVSAVSPNVTIVPFVSIVSGLLVTELIKIVTNIAEPKSLGRLCAFDFDTVTLSEVEKWSKNPSCFLCSATTLSDRG